MPDPDIIGPLFSPHVLEEAAVRTLKRWLPTYATAVKTRYDLELPRIKSWGLSNSKDRFPEKGLPAIVVTATGPGRDGGPEETSGGAYRSSYSLGVIVTISHANGDTARKTAQLYGTAILGSIVQRRSLGLPGVVATWKDHDYPFGIAEQRTRAAAEHLFSVQVDEVVNWRMGPKDDTPPESIPDEYPEITEVEVDMEAE
jgi:hypothetical protein